FPRDLHPLPSLPTRRSSDLASCNSRCVFITNGPYCAIGSLIGCPLSNNTTLSVLPLIFISSPSFLNKTRSCWAASSPLTSISLRSEEHTSELQSREKLVCRL